MAASIRCNRGVVSCGAATNIAVRSRCPLGDQWSPKPGHREETLMKVGVTLPQTEMTTDPIAILDFPQAAEELGYDTFSPTVPSGLHRGSTPSRSRMTTHRGPGRARHRRSLRPPANLPMGALSRFCSCFSGSSLRGFESSACLLGQDGQSCAGYRPLSRAER